MSKQPNTTIKLLYGLLQRLIERCQGNRSANTQAGVCLLNRTQFFDVRGGNYHRIVHVLQLRLHSCSLYTRQIISPIY